MFDMTDDQKAQLIEAISAKKTIDTVASKSGGKFMGQIRIRTGAVSVIIGRTRHYSFDTAEDAIEAADVMVAEIVGDTDELEPEMEVVPDEDITVTDSTEGNVMLSVEDVAEANLDVTEDTEDLGEIAGRV